LRLRKEGPGLYSPILWQIEMLLKKSDRTGFQPSLAGVRNLTQGDAPGWYESRRWRQGVPFQKSGLFQQSLKPFVVGGFLAGRLKAKALGYQLCAPSQKQNGDLLGIV